MTFHARFQNTGAPTKHLVLAGLLLFPILLNAQTLDHQGRVDFNLHLQSVNSDWQYDNETRRTRISRAGFGWTESLGSYLSGGLLLGYLDLSQADNPLDTGKITTGYYGGLKLDGNLIETEYLNLKLSLSFLYNSTQKYRNDQRVNNVWTQSEIQLMAQIPFGERLGIRLAANNYRIRGEQRNSGSVSSINSFRQDTSTGYSAGLDVVIERGASIGFDWLAGSREGGRIYFRRLF